jgi:hypothetical protein
MQVSKTLLIPILIIIIGCSKSEIQIPDQPLNGLVDGEPWEYQSANAFLFSSDLRYRMNFISANEFGSNDPCGIPVPASNHLSMIFKPAIGSYSFPLPETNQSIKFVLQDGKELFATSGFLEVIFLDRDFMRGYMQAILDDENTVEGIFEVRFCN